MLCLILFSPRFSFPKKRLLRSSFTSDKDVSKVPQKVSVSLAGSKGFPQISSTSVIW